MNCLNEAISCAVYNSDIGEMGLGYVTLTVKGFLALIDIVRKRVGLRFRKSFKVL